MWGKSPRLAAKPRHSERSVTRREAQIKFNTNNLPCIFRFDTEKCRGFFSQTKPHGKTRLRSGRSHANQTRVFNNSRAWLRPRIFGGSMPPKMPESKRTANPAPRYNSAPKRAKPRYPSPFFKQHSSVASPAHFRRFDAAENAREQAYRKPSPAVQLGSGAGEATLTKPVFSTTLGRGFARAFSAVRCRRKCQGFAETPHLFAIYSQKFPQSNDCSQSWLSGRRFVGGRIWLTQRLLPEHRQSCPRNQSCQKLPKIPQNKKRPENSSRFAVAKIA